MHAVEEVVGHRTPTGESNPAAPSSAGGKDRLWVWFECTSRGEPYGADQVHSWRVIWEVPGAGAHRCRTNQGIEWKVPTCSGGASSRNSVHAARAPQTTFGTNFDLHGQLSINTRRIRGMTGSVMMSRDSGKRCVGMRRVLILTCASATKVTYRDARCMPCTSRVGHLA